VQNRLEHNHERRVVVKMMGLNLIKDNLVFFLKWWFMQNDVSVVYEVLVSHYIQIMKFINDGDVNLVICKILCI